MIELPAPSLRPGGVLVAVAASLVSVGTEKLVINLAQASLLGKARQRPDQVRQVINKVQQEGLLTTYQRVMNRLDTLSPLGYSCAGTIIAVGDGVSDLHVGDRVACAGGGYANHAEIVYVPRNLVAPLPAIPDYSVDFEEAAFTTLGAVALQGIRQAAPSLGETVSVIGLGLLGLLTVQMLKANGCRVIGMDLDLTRCKLAETLGCEAAATENADFIDLALNHTQGLGVDAVIITAGTPSNDPIVLAAEICRDRARVVAVGLVGLNVPRKPFYDKEIDLRLSRSYGPGRYDSAYEEGGHDYPLGYVRWTENRNMQAFLDLLAQRKIDLQPIISHRFTIDDALQAYDLITGDQAATALGVILNYPHHQDLTPVSAPIWLRPEVSPAALPKTRSEEGMNLGLVGAGTFAQGVLLPVLAAIPGANLRAVCNTSGLAARHVAGKYNAAYCTADPADLFADEDLDAVIITTRHDSHAALSIQALQSGRHVFVEKPLAIDIEGIQAIASAHDLSRGQSDPPILMVGFNRRFAPLAHRLRTFVDRIDAPLALHYQVNAGYIPLDHWTQDPSVGGGRIIGEVCHFLDFLVFLTASHPHTIYSQALPNAGRYANDNLAANITFTDGSLATLTYLANGDKTYPKEQLHIFGGGAVAFLDDFRRLTLVKGGRTKIHRTPLRQDKGHRAELQTFLGAIQTGSGAPIPFTDLAAVTLATLKIEESLRVGTLVQLDLSALQPHQAQ